MELAKLAAEVQEEERSTGERAALGLGGAAALGASTDYLSGRKTLYHGTSKKNAEQIKQEGLRADKGGSGAAKFSEQYAGRSKGQVHATSVKPYARFYANLADESKDQGTKDDFEKIFGGRVDSQEDYDQAVKRQQKTMWKAPFTMNKNESEILKVNMPYAEYDKRFKLDDDGGPVRYMAGKTDQDIDSKYIKGGVNNPGVASRLKETAAGLPHYIKKHPGRFGSGVGLAALGGTGLYQSIHQKEAGVQMNMFLSKQANEEQNKSKDAALTGAAIGGTLTGASGALLAANRNDEIMHYPNLHKARGEIMREHRENPQGELSDKLLDAQRHPTYTKGQNRALRNGAIGGGVLGTIPGVVLGGALGYGGSKLHEHYQEKRASEEEEKNNYVPAAAIGGGIAGGLIGASSAVGRTGNPENKKKWREPADAQILKERMDAMAKHRENVDWTGELKGKMWERINKKEKESGSISREEFGKRQVEEERKYFEKKRDVENHPLYKEQRHAARAQAGKMGGAIGAGIGAIGAGGLAYGASKMHEHNQEKRASEELPVGQRVNNVIDKRVKEMENKQANRFLSKQAGNIEEEIRAALAAERQETAAEQERKDGVEVMGTIGSLAGMYGGYKAIGPIMENAPAGVQRFAGRHPFVTATGLILPGAIAGTAVGEAAGRKIYGDAPEEKMAFADIRDLMDKIAAAYAPLD